MLNWGPLPILMGWVHIAAELFNIWGKNEKTNVTDEQGPNNFAFPFQIYMQLYTQTSLKPVIYEHTISSIITCTWKSK